MTTAAAEAEIVMNPSARRLVLFVFAAAICLTIHLVILYCEI